MGGHGKASVMLHSYIFMLDCCWLLTTKYTKAVLKLEAFSKRW